VDAIPWLSWRLCVLSEAGVRNPFRSEKPCPVCDTEEASGDAVASAVAGCQRGMEPSAHALG
jgi:hypothetical protein